MAGTIVLAGGINNPHRSRGVVRIEANITTDASGVATATVIGVAFGRIVGFMSDAGLDASAVLTFTDAKTGATVFVHTQSTEGTPVAVRPTTNVVTVAGAVVAAADTAPNIWRDIIVSGQIALGVTAGGNAETGKIALLIDESKRGELALTV